MAATLIGLTGIGARAQSLDGPGLPALWQSAFSIRSGGGYKDNVFLSHQRPQGSAAVSAGADFSALRFAPDGPQFTFFAGADANFFLSTKPAHDEYSAFAQAQLEKDLTAGITSWLAAEYASQDQILDVAFLDPSISVTNPAVRATQIRGHTLGLRPGLSVDLSSQNSLALEIPATRQYYEQPLDDYWNTGLKLTLGHSYGNSSQFSLSYEPAWRWYDTDPARTTSGAPIPGSNRQRFLQDANLSWRHHWDEGKRWRTVAKLGGRLVEENGAGYADYGQLSTSAQIRYRAREWEASVESGVRAYRYASQTISATDSEKLRRADWTTTLRLERGLTKHLSAIVSYEHEEILSNVETETYTVNTISGSLQWAF